MGTYKTERRGRRDPKQSHSSGNSSITRDEFRNHGSEKDDRSTRLPQKSGQITGPTYEALLENYITYLTKI
ncbi:hypothetical protein EVAR_77894_1 [Eumeta japonica]|uniref:Uncharacterized protein n=1 Tax=Eumeta variegata TaxID=151549 RepID=A0A4C1ZDG1_EUMVA|nr:hypothetical protein EVAR_77894_1 [Eumeta japonica]